MSQYYDLNNTGPEVQGRLDQVPTNETDIVNIKALIPAQATPQNQLADKQYVDDGIATASATYRGAYNLVSDLELTVAATEQQIAAALATVMAAATPPIVPDNNDYCFVQVPTADATPTQIARVDRYKYNGTVWAFEFSLNNSGFTAAQWAALNSGITSGLVAKLGDLPTNSELTTLLGGKEDKSNKVTSLSAESTDTQYPSAKCVYDLHKANADDIDDIEEKIPSCASSQNKLVDQQTMNSSIATATATYRGAYNLVSDLSLTVSATEQQIAAALATVMAAATPPIVPDNNDYCYVQVPTSDATPTQIARVDRYKYNGAAWGFEYSLNNSGFTAAQWAALNSGITSGLVAKLSDLPTNSELTTLLAGKQDTINDLSDIRSGAAKGETAYQKPVGGIPSEDMSSGVQSSLQKAENAAPQSTTYNKTEVDGMIGGIEEKIPSGASSQNKLVDQQTMNSSIATASATYRGAYNLVSDLELTTAATEQQIAAALATVMAAATPPIVPDNNDYCFVQVPTADATPTQIARVDRYKFNGTAWAFEFSLNNSGFTAAQWAALNSGITSGLVTKLSDLPTNSELTTLLAGKQDTINDLSDIRSGAAKGETAYQKPVGGIPSEDMSSGVQSSLQKAENAAPQSTTYNKTEVDGMIGGIEEKIPSGASSQNKLVDQQTMNSSIATASATYRGAYNLVSDLELTTAATEQQIAAALATVMAAATPPIVPDNNDYCFVQVPTADATPTQIARVDRYKFNGTAWAFEFSLNNSGFTAAQWAALNSGITSGLVAKLSDLPSLSELTTLLAGKQNTLTFDSTPTAGSTNPVQSGGIKTYVDNKTDAQDTVIANAIAAQDAEIDSRMDQQDAIISTLNGQDVIVVSSVPASGVANKIYRVYGTTSYSDYMFNAGALTTPIKIAEYSYPGVDDTPTIGSQKLVKSGGVYSSIDEEKTIYDSDSDDNLDISDALGNVVVEFKGGHIRTKYFDSRDFAYLDLSGKNVLFFGDSITYYKEYVNAFSSKTGCTPYNRGLGSSCISNGGTGVPASFCIRVDATPDNRQDGAGMAIGMPNNVDIDIVIIQGGINDFGYTNSGNKTAFLGDIGVADSSEIRQSFYGGIKYVISRIKTLYPNALVCVLGLIPTYSPSAFPNWSMVTLSDESNILSTLAKQKTSEDKSWFDYNEALEVTAKQFGALFIPLENIGMNPLIESDRIKYYKDGLHPNNTGGELIANKIINSIKNLKA